MNWKVYNIELLKTSGWYLRLCWYALIILFVFVNFLFLKLFGLPIHQTIKFIKLFRKFSNLDLSKITAGMIRLGGFGSDATFKLIRSEWFSRNLLLAYLAFELISNTGRMTQVNTISSPLYHKTACLINWGDGMNHVSIVWL